MGCKSRSFEVVWSSLNHSYLIYKMGVSIPSSQGCRENSRKYTKSTPHTDVLKIWKLILQSVSGEAFQEQSLLSFAESEI